MRITSRARMAGWSFLAVAVLWSAPVFAQCDVSGEWSARSREDWEDRAQLGTNLGDYTGFPINDRARQYGHTWDASILSLPTQQGIPHPGQYFMRGPGPNFRMAKLEDPTSGEVIGYTVVGMWGRADRVIWTDGREPPPDWVEHTWAGFSTGRCERGMFVVETTHFKFGYHRRNGVPASIKARTTEYFILHGDQLTHVQFTEDPVYLTEPLIRTTDFERNPNQNVGPRGLGFEIVDEIAEWNEGYVPSFPLGTVPDDFAKNLGLPLEATEGGAETIYPEYLPRLRTLMREMEAEDR